MGALCLAVGVVLVVVTGACGQVASGTHDAALPASDGDASPLPDAGPAGSIRGIQHVFAMRTADQSLTASFTTSGGRALILASGSARRAAAGIVGMSILVDGQSIGGCEVYSNETASDKAFGSAAWVLNLDAGTHTVAIMPSATTTMDGNDFVDLTVLELGPQVAVSALFELLHGPPPFASTFMAHGQPGILLLSGSGYRAGTAGENATLSLSAVIDGQALGALATYSNEALSHKALVPGFLALQPSAGSHRFELQPGATTIANADDRASALWIELGTDVATTAVLSQVTGALPKTGTFTTAGGQLLLLVSGSAFARTSQTVIEVSVELDGQPLGSARTTTVEPSSHKAVVPTVFVTSAPAGQHALTLVTGATTSTDSNDYFNVTAIELLH